MTTQETCVRCGNPAKGYAMINNQRYCHATGHSCYERELQARSARNAARGHDTYKYLEFEKDTA